MRLLANGASLEAALTAEDAFATAPFLLDCQRAVHGALAALGPEYAEAAEAVRQETTLLVQRLPGLETLRFSDGTPFATQETAAWLRIPAPRPSPSPPGSVSPPQEDPAGDHVAAARLLAGNGRLAAALRELEMARSPSRAANLRLDTIALEMLIRAGEGESALTLAQSIAENTAAHKLDDWDPEQAILALGPVREALLRFAPEGRKELAEVNRRIAGIMPSSLLR
jgi:type VI secretion system protein VasJ